MAGFTFHFDVSEVHELAHDMGEVRGPLLRATRDVVADSAKRVREGWHDNANESGEAYAKWYIETLRVDGPDSHGDDWVAIIHPDEGMAQGHMSTGFEYGSINQRTPHLDAHRATDVEEPRFIAAAGPAGYEALRRALRR